MEHLLVPATVARINYSSTLIFAYDDALILQSYFMNRFLAILWS